MENKTCSKCKAEKPADQFYKRSGGGLHSACKICERAMAKDWYERNREKAIDSYKSWRDQNLDTVKQYRVDNRARAYRAEVVRKYGVPADWFDKQIERQANKCLCCNREFTWECKQTTPHVDHCHGSKNVRGILCNRCNTVLGLCKDDPALLINLSEYLKKCHGTSATQ